MKSYDKYDESVFTNEVLTGQYIDRLYNYYFAAYRSPVQAEATLGAYDDSKTKNTEEIGGTVGNYINPNKNLQLASEADAYYGAALTASVTNNPYTRIRFCNLLLEKMDGAGEVLSESFRNTSKGQAYYLRALQYYNLVRTYGGVPIVLTVSNASNTDESIRTPRSTATECFTQIIKDFDSAAAMLPAVWPGGSINYGRATSVAALAMQSRVLLTAASPLFNKDWDNPGSPKWQAALAAGLKAEIAATSAGYGLYGSTAKEWAEMSWPYEAIAIFAVVLLNAMMGYVQESRAEAAIAALRAMSAADATSHWSVNAAAFLPNRYRPWRHHPDQGRRHRSRRCARDQDHRAPDGGGRPHGREPAGREENSARIAGEVGLGDRDNMVFSGTATTYGHGKAVVTSTGMQSEMGRIAGLLKETPEQSTPLQRELDRTGKLLGLMVVAIAVVMIATIILVEHVRGLSAIVDVLIFGVALAVAAVPEGLPAVVTAVLSMGVQRMAKRNAIVRHLAAVETLGSADVIASDKTGTLTKNEMTVRKVVTASGSVTLMGTGYAPTKAARLPTGIRRTRQ